MDRLCFGSEHRLSILSTDTDLLSYSSTFYFSHYIFFQLYCTIDQRSTYSFVFQAEIVKRLNAICAQVIPFLSQEVSSSLSCYFILMLIVWTVLGLIQGSFFNFFSQFPNFNSDPQRST